MGDGSEAATSVGLSCRFALEDGKRNKKKLNAAPPVPGADSRGCLAGGAMPEPRLLAGAMKLRWERAHGAVESDIPSKDWQRLASFLSDVPSKDRQRLVRCLFGRQSGSADVVPEEHSHEERHDQEHPQYKAPPPPAKSEPAHAILCELFRARYRFRPRVLQSGAFEEYLMVAGPQQQPAPRRLLPNRQQITPVGRVEQGPPGGMIGASPSACRRRIPPASRYRPERAGRTGRTVPGSIPIAGIEEAEAWEWWGLRRPIWSAPGDAR